MNNGLRVRSWKTILLFLLLNTNLVVAEADVLQISDSSSTTRFPLIAADGSKVVFRATTDLINDGQEYNQGVYYFDIQSGELVNTTPGMGDAYLGDPEISPNGRYIIFNSDWNPNGLNPSNNYELFRVDTDTGVIMRLTYDQGTSSISTILFFEITLDNSHVIIFSQGDYLGSNGLRHTEAYIMNIDGTNIRQLTTGSGSGGYRYLGFSNDLTKMLLGDHNAAGLLLLNMSTGNIESIPETANYFNASISGDGSTIITAHKVPSVSPNNIGSMHYELFAIDTETFEQNQITFNPDETDTYQMHVAPNANKVVFWSYGNLTGDNPNGDLQYFTANLDGTELTQVIQSAPFQDYDTFRISNDGTKVVFVTRDYPNNFYNIATVNSDGSNYLEIIDTRAPSYLFGGPRVSISSSGDLIAFDADSTPDDLSHDFEIFLWGSQSGSAMASNGGKGGGGALSLSLLALFWIVSYRRTSLRLKTLANLFKERLISVN